MGPAVSSKMAGYLMALRHGAQQPDQQRDQEEPGRRQQHQAVGHVPAGIARHRQHDEAQDLAGTEELARNGDQHQHEPVTEAVADAVEEIVDVAGARIERYSAQGELIDTVPMPCSNITKIAFGGHDLRTVFVTTARKGLSEEQLATQPLAGGLFRFRVPTPGQIQHQF